MKFQPKRKTKKKQRKEKVKLHMNSFRLSNLINQVKVITSTYMNADDDSQYSEVAKINNSMAHNSDCTGVHVSKLYHPCSRWKLKERPWTQQDEQSYRPPVDQHLQKWLSKSNLVLPIQILFQTQGREFLRISTETEGFFAEEGQGRGRQTYEGM